MLNLTKNTLLLVDIAIMPSMQKKGIGAQVMKLLIMFAGSNQLKLELSVAKSNILAFTFYTKLGFKIISDQGYHIKMQHIG